MNKTKYRKGYHLHGALRDLTQRDDTHMISMKTVQFLTALPPGSSTS